MKKDIFELVTDDREKAEAMREADRREQQRNKVAENRQMWADLGVKQTNVPCYEDVAGYVKATAALATAVRLYDSVEKRDETTIDALSNVKPKYGVQRDEVERLSSLTEDRDTLLECSHILWALRQAREAKALGFSPDTAADDTGYYLAREFVLAKYAKGAWDMLLFNLQNRNTNGLRVRLDETEQADG